MRRLIAATIGAASILVAIPFQAAATPTTQTITGTIGNSIALQLSAPTVDVPLVLGANTINGGTLTVTGNVLTSVNVTFDKTAMTAFSGAAYNDSVKLAAPMVLTATGQGTTVGTGTATSTTGGVVLGTSVLGSSTYGLSYAQPVSVTDPAGTYRIVVTYTGAATL